MSAPGAVDTALWDIRGKVLGKTTCDMLGARRDSVPAYASALLWKEDFADLVAEAARYVQEGCRAVKMRLGKNSAEYGQVRSGPFVCLAHTMSSIGRNR
jgi:L-alanine-DL-glutamate epimerase-like enolase superfamily enzyme